MSRKDYYGRLLQVYRSYRRKKTRLAYLPVRLWLETTSVCNLRCVMCPNKDLNERREGFMDFPLFRKIIDEARRFVFDVNLIHRGEGLLHPEFPRMVRYSHDAGIYTKFHTNATILDEARTAPLSPPASTGFRSPSTATTARPTRASGSTPISKGPSAMWSGSSKSSASSGRKLLTPPSS